MYYAHQHISDLGWDALHVAVIAGHVTVEDATMQTTARYELLRQAIERRIISAGQSRMQMRAALLEYYRQLAAQSKEQA